MAYYQVEYWFLSFHKGEDLGYDYNIIDVKAISPKQAILLAKDKAHKGAKHFKIVGKLSEKIAKKLYE